MRTKKSGWSITSIPIWFALGLIIIAIITVGFKENKDIRSKASELHTSPSLSKLSRPGEVLVRLRTDLDDIIITDKNTSLQKIPKESIPINSITGKSETAKKTIDTLKKYSVDSIEKISIADQSIKTAKTTAQPIYRWAKIKFSEEKIKAKLNSNIHSSNRKFTDSDINWTRYMTGELQKENTVFEKVEPNFIRTIDEAIPNDPQFPEQWGLKNLANPNTDIHASTAWDITTGNSSVIIGVVDTGISTSHEDLTEDLLWTNTDEIPNNGLDDDLNGYIDDYHGVGLTSTNSIQDDNGHGTHVSGIIAAKTNNSVGVSGICWNCKIMPIKTFGSDGSSDDAACANGILYAVSNGSTVINASWGGNIFSSILQDAVSYALANNVVFVAAAGNNNQTASTNYPAAFPDVITVGAVNSIGLKADFSNYGNTMEIVAPGVNILSTYNSRLNSYRSLSGTSMAAPFISGTVALMQSAGITNNREIYKRIILASAQQSSGNWNTSTGFGLINAYAAIVTPTQTTACAITNITPQTTIVNSYPIYGHAFSFGPFSRYTIEAGLGTSPTSWNSLGITLQNSGLSEITEGLLGTINTTNYANSTWSLRLTVYPTQGSSQSCMTTFVHTTTQDMYVDSHNTGTENGTLAYPYRTIQRAVNASNEYTTIHVKSGTYNENVVIQKSNITLMGEPGATLVSACTNPFQCSMDAISIYYTDLSNAISNVSVKNMTILANGANGIKLSGFANNNVFENNTIIQSKIKPCSETYCDDGGIRLDMFITGTTIKYNHIISFTNGIWLNGESVENSIIEHNYTARNLYSGIYFHTLAYGGNSTVKNNTAVNNSIGGIVSSSSDANKYYENILVNNRLNGFVDTFSTNTTAYHNTYIANTSSPIFIQNRNPNTFLDSLLNTGSYYDIFHMESQSAKDTNNDGIIDIPYQINTSDRDTAPYRYPYARGSAMPSIIHTPYLVNLNQTVTIQSVSPDISFGQTHSLNKIWLNKGSPLEFDAPIVNWNNKSITITASDGIRPGIQFVTVQKSDGTYINGGYFVIVMQEDFDVTSSSIQLQAGWNWITVRSVPINPKLESVFGSIAGKFDKILSEKLIYATYVPTIANTLRDIIPGMYMIHMTSPGTLQLFGTPVSSTQPISLHAGWNWIGYFGNTSLSITTAFASISGKYQQVLSQDLYYDPSNPSDSSLGTLEPNQGYVIYSNVDQTLTYPQSANQNVLGTQTTPTNAPCKKTITNNFTNIFGTIPEYSVDIKNIYTVRLLTKTGITAGCGTLSNGKLKITRAFGQETINGKTYPGFTEGEPILLELVDPRTNKTVQKIPSTILFTSDLTTHKFVTAPIPIATIKITPRPTPKIIKTIQ